MIQGNLQFLEDAPALADDAHGQRLVDAATRRAAELTGKLLAFSRARCRSRSRSPSLRP